MTDQVHDRVPDGTQIFFTRTVPDGWPADFLPTGVPPGRRRVRIDHVGLTQPFDSFDEAALFYREVLGLGPEAVTEIPAPYGLIRDRAVANADRSVRLTATAALLRRGGWAPGVPAPQHVAFGTDDIAATARALRAAGAPIVAVPANYHDDLDARFDLDPARLAAMRELGLFYDEAGTGAFLHLYTEVLGGRVFFEFVQRIGGYDGYGAANAPVRTAAQRRARLTEATAGS